MTDPRDPFDLAGVTIDGKYRVASVIGDGGFGVVYRGVHKGFGELIAIKCLKLPTELDEKGRSDFLENLQEEGRLLHRLSKVTSGIVQALDVGAFTSPAGIWIPYLVLEWLEGETLGQHLKDRVTHGEASLSLPEAMRLLDPAARALGVAHQQKIAHRDVKPANLFVTEVSGKRTTKVLDFGIAKVLSDHSSFTTALESTGLAPTAFTPRYGAPEQFNKQRGASGPWTDVFALALVLVECASGKRALEGDDPTQLYIASADPAIRPTLRKRGVPTSDQVEAVLRKALEVEPRDRYADASEFWDALEAVVDSQAKRASREDVRPVSSGPPTDVDGESWMATNEFAAKNALKVDGSDGSKSAFGPTVPVESRKSAPRSLPAVAAKPTGPSIRVRSGDADRDPMAETPPGQRTSGEQQVVTKPSAAAEENQRSYAFVWTILAVGVFLGGTAFAYYTFFSDSSSKGKGGPSIKPSSSVASSIKPDPRPPPTGPSTKQSAGPIKSSSPSVVLSASASASSGPTEPPEAEFPNMIKIGAASFKMGAAGVDSRISKDFYIDKYEVTYGAYKECVAARKCPKAETVMDPTAADPEKYSEEWSPRCNARHGQANQPMNCVNAKSAEMFCEWKSKRLPTEAEWELVARGTAGRAFAWGSADPSCTSACADRNSSCYQQGAEITSCEVGHYPTDKTADGVFDIGGNVSEWTADSFGDLPGGNDPRVTSGDGRVVRGGSFILGIDSLSAVYRRNLPEKAAEVDVGFRCAADSTQSKQ